MGRRLGRVAMRMRVRVRVRMRVARTHTRMSCCWSQPSALLSTTRSLLACGAMSSITDLSSSLMSCSNHKHSQSLVVLEGKEGHPL